MMRRLFCLLVLLLMTTPYMELRAQDQEDAVMLFSTTTLTKSFGKENKWTAGFMSEYRHLFHEGISKTTEYFVRPSIGYQLLPWLSLQYQMDFVASASSGFNWRFIPEVTMSHKVGDFTFAFRQRVMTTWKAKAGTNSSVLRSRVRVDYRIPKTPLGVQLYLEPYWCQFSRNSFAWLQKTRWCAALHVKLTERLTFIPAYEHMAFHNRSGRYNRRTYNDHVIYMMLSVKL